MPKAIKIPEKVWNDVEERSLTQFSKPDIFRHTFKLHQTAREKGRRRLALSSLMIPATDLILGITIGVLCGEGARAQLQAEVDDRRTQINGVVGRSIARVLRRGVIAQRYMGSRLEPHFRNRTNYDALCNVEKLYSVVSPIVSDLSVTVGGALRFTRSKGVADEKAVERIGKSTGLLWTAKTSGAEAARVRSALGEPYGKLNRYEFAHNDLIQFTSATRAEIDGYAWPDSGCPAMNITSQVGWSGTMLTTALLEGTDLLLCGKPTINGQ